MTSDSTAGQAPPTNSKSKRQPLVSIIIPFWNAASFLQCAIDSVLAQTHVNWELLLVDDGSTDGSTEISNRCVERYPERVRCLQHDNRSNRGVSASRNLGLRHATGEFACYLDADDVFLPHKLERELAIFDSQPDAEVVCGALEYWFSWTGDERDARRDFIITLGVPGERLYEPPKLLLHNLRAGGRKPGTSSIMFRRERLLVDLCEDSFIGHGDDQVLWAQLSLRRKIFVTDECLFKYRQHPDSFCAVAMSGGQDLTAWSRFLNWLDEYLISEKIDEPEIWKTLRNCQKSIALQIRFAPIKLLARRVLPIRARYWLRDQWIKLQSLRRQ